MAENLYVKDEEMKLFGVATEADSTEVWELLAEAVSRVFDRECEVPDGFFMPAGADVSLKSYRANGTPYVELFPYIPGSITIIDVDGTDYFEAAAADRSYREKEDFLIFNSAIADGTPIDVTARYGFPTLPSDITLACIEQGLLMWRRKDLSFAEMSGVSSAIANAEFSPSFASTVERYRERYRVKGYFA